jgi:hypothetical protein
MNKSLPTIIRRNQPIKVKDCSKKVNSNLTKLLSISVFLLFSGAHIINAQSIPADTSKIKTITEDSRKFGNFTFESHIKTIKLTNPEWEMSYPILALGSGHKLQLTFDVLADESKSYSYQLFHLNSSWTGLDATFYEFGTGFEKNEIYESEASYSSTVPYHHYKLELPNDDIQLKISGNYLIRVYEDGKKTPVFQRRFVVYENRCSISGRVDRAMAKNHGSTSHKISFEITTHGLQLSDPYSELEVKILPNNNWHRAHEGFQPLYIKGDKLIYADKDENIFDAGNEYRTINIKDLAYEALMVESIRRINTDYHVKLRPDEARRYLRYQDHQDLNGQFFIEKSNSWTPELDADYVNVYFTLQVKQPILSGIVFVYGALTDYTFSSANAMNYNPQKKQYELRIKLKQGFHDYQYVALDAYYNYKPDFTTIEGSHWETKNDYIMYVYYKDFQSGFHRVVGFTRMQSNQ